MMNLQLFFQNKSYVFLFLGSSMLLLVIFVISFFLLRPTPLEENQLINPTPTSASSTSTKDPNDPYSDAYKDSVEKIRVQEQATLDQDKKVSAFINKLPVQGINFTASYDISSNSVTVTIPSDKKAEGEKEFDNYLGANGIKERSWIQNLTIRYRDIDPFEH